MADEEDFFFWFDPFATAPDGELVDGIAGGAVGWPTGSTYPRGFMRIGRQLGREALRNFSNSRFGLSLLLSD